MMAKRNPKRRDAGIARLSATIVFLMVVTACTPALDREGLTADSDLLRKEVLLEDAGQVRSHIDREIVSISSSASNETIDPHYRVGPGDVLSVNVFGDDELSDLTVRIDADGFIQVPIIELLDVGGKTTKEIQQELKRAYSAEFNNPWVIVGMVQFRSQPVYLIGEFNSPGVKYLEEPINLVQALGLGSGLSSEAYLRGARLLRDNDIVPIDIKGILRDGDFNQNVWLQGGDTVYVPGRQDLKVFILGAVEQPGGQPFGSGVTLLEALANAQGAAASQAKLSDVRIIRSHSAVRGELMVVDMQRILAGESPDLPLRAGDIVYVPKTPLGDWNDVIARISPTVQLFGATLQPFVQLKFLTGNNR